MKMRIAAWILLALASSIGLAPSQTTGQTTGQMAGVSGRVVQSLTHAPLAGITVRVASTSRVTSADGRFSFLELEPGRHIVEVETENYLRPPIGYMATLTAGQTLRGVEIALTPLASIEGKVVADDGTPVSLATIRLIPVRAFQFRQLAGTSGRDGTFKLDHVPPGEYALTVRYSSLTSSDKTRVFHKTSRPVLLKPGSAASGLVLPVHWEAPVRVQGRMEPANPPEKLGVSFAADDDTVSLFDLMGASVPIQPDGSFELTGVLPGKNHLYLLTSPQTSDGAGMGVAGSITVDVPTNGLSGVQMHLYAKDVTVKGRAAPGTRVFLQAVGPLPITEGFEAITGGDGVFQLQVERRKYSIVSRDLRAVSLDGSAVSGGILDLSSGPAARTLELLTSSAQATVKGKVTFENRAVPQAYVDFWSVVSRIRYAMRTDQNGDYEQRLPAGEYHVSAGREWAFTDAGERTITAEEGEEKQLLLPLAR